MKNIFIKFLSYTFYKNILNNILIRLIVFVLRFDRINVRILFNTLTAKSNLD